MQRFPSPHSTPGSNAKRMHQTSSPDSASSISRLPTPTPPTPAAELDAAQVLCHFGAGAYAPSAEPPLVQSRKSPAGHRTMQSTMAIMEEKHARWQERLRAQLNECTCEVTRSILFPAAHFDAMETAVSRVPLEPEPRAHALPLSGERRRLLNVAAAPEFTAAERVAPHQALLAHGGRALPETSTAARNPRRPAEDCTSSARASRQGAPSSASKPPLCIDCSSQARGKACMSSRVAERKNTPARCGAWRVVRP